MNNCFLLLLFLIRKKIFCELFQLGNREYLKLFNFLYWVCLELDDLDFSHETSVEDRGGLKEVRFHLFTQ